MYSRTEELMVQSAAKGDIKTVSKLLADKVNANSKDSVGCSALSKAAMGRISLN